MRMADGPVTWSNRSIAIGSDIAVCNDDSQSEYVHYQMPGGLLTRGIVNPSFTLQYQTLYVASQSYFLDSTTNNKIFDQR